MEISFDMLRKLDPFAICLVDKKRTYYYALKRILDIFLAGYRFDSAVPGYRHHWHFNQA